MSTQKNTEKLTEKAFSRLWITSIVGILVCIACLCSTTWAWFSADQAAESNVVQSGRFDLDISITEESGVLEKAIEEQNATVIELTDLSNGKMSCKLPKGKYTVVLKITQDTTVTKGFCTMSVEGKNKVYHTDSIYADGADPFTFTLDVQEEITMLFSPAWGIPAMVDVELGETLQIGTESGEAEQTTEEKA